jgi:membrane fusion protein (multidrug efflux system)
MIKRFAGARFVLGGLAMAVAVCLLSGCGKAEETTAPPPPQVNVVKLVDGSVPMNFAYTARVRGEREIEIRARVPGILEKRFYVEGAKVEAGQLLFRIDPKPLAAALRGAEGRLAVERSRLVETEQQLKRVSQLQEQGMVTRRERDLAEAAFASANAGVDTASAEREAATLDLAYTEVRAPISGITGREARSEGSLVNPTDDSSLLTVITQSDRLYVEFTMPETEARAMRAALVKQADAVVVRLQPTGGDVLSASAQITFVDARVDGDSGTVQVRATFANADGQLAPGQFVRARLEGLSSAAGVYVPARAVLYGADGPFVWKVDPKNIVQFAPVKLSPGHGELLRVDAGLAGGDRVIVDGVLKVLPDATVNAKVVDIQAKPEGVGSGS